MRVTQPTFRKMFWREKVAVCEEKYKLSLPVIYLLRLSGLFPIKIQRNDYGTLYMQWSPLYAAYSYFIDIFLHVSISVGEYIDFSQNRTESIRIHAETDLIIGLVDASWLQVAMFFMIVGISTRFLEFFGYVKCINEIDEILQITHSKWEAVKEFCECYVWWVLVFFAVFFDYVMYVVTLYDQFSAFYILKLYLWHYLICVIVMFGEYQYQYLGTSLCKRISKLNLLLEAFCVVGNKGLGRKRQVLARNKSVQQIMNSIYINIDQPENRIGKLMHVYMKLVDAADHQNNLLGLTSLVVVGLAFWHLVLCMYYLFYEMTEVHPHPVTIAVYVILIIFHTSRLLMITEAWYSCCVEIETTKNWVCKLHYSAVGRRIRKKLLTFQMILCLRRIEFTLAGFYSIDRAMVTSVLSATTTYVLVLLNYRATE